MEINLVELLSHVKEKQFRSSNNVTFQVEQLPPKETSARYSTNLDRASKIKMDGTGPLGKLKALTLHTALHNAIEKFPKLISHKYKYKQDSNFYSTTFSEYYQLCCMAAKSLIKLGLKPHTSVCIAGHNALPWFIAYFGAIFSGGIACGVYVTNNEETSQFIMNDCCCYVVFAGSTDILKKYISISENCQYLKALVQYDGEFNSAIKNSCTFPIYTFPDFMKLGIDVKDEELLDKIKNLIPNECCSIIYTSGTTGNPKGVMMSHDNLVWTACCVTEYMKFHPGEEILISFLPLSHIAAQLCDIVIPIICQAVTYFAQPDALKGSLGLTLKEVRPTVFLGVPRVFEKIMEQMREMGATMSFIKRSISTWAKDVGYRSTLAKIQKQPVPFGYTIANCMVFNKIRKALGFDRCINIYSAAAPLSQEVISYFASLDILISEIYGMSECTGPSTIELPNETTLGSVGKVLPDFHVKLYNKNAEGEGEICMSGRHVFMGYVNLEEKTKEVFDSDWWLHSGDIGKLNETGFLFITGRIKELIITAGGENIAPVPIEDRIKSNLPLVSNCVVIGDKRKYLVVLLTIKCVIQPDTQVPTDELSPAVKRWCQYLRYDVREVSKLIADNDPRIINAVEDAIKITNESAISKASMVQKWVFLPQDFSIGGGELGPTLKVKRNVVHEMYADVIAKMYE